MASIWPKALSMLGDAPELEAKALIEHLMGGVPPAKVEEKHLRTFQRRVRDWRLEHGPGKEVLFTRDHAPGKVLAMDWTDMGTCGRRATASCSWVMKWLSASCPRTASSAAASAWGIAGHTAPGKAG